MRFACLVAIAACCPPEPAKPAPVVAPPTPDARILPVFGPEPFPPEAKVAVVDDNAFGVSAPDPYRWMETEDAERDAWMKAHGDFAARQIAQYKGRDALLARIRELGNSKSAVYGVQVANGVTIYSSSPANVEIDRLVVRGPDNQERVLVDPATLGTAEHHAAFGAYSLSPDGKYVGYVLSLGGAEAGAIHILEVATGKPLPDVTDQIWGEFPPQWLPDAKGYYYTQMVPAPPGGDPMTNMIVRLHRLGTPAASDVTIVARDAGMLALDPAEFPVVYRQPGSTWAVAQAGGARLEFKIAVAKVAAIDVSGTAKTPWKPVAALADGVENYAVHGDRLYMQTFGGAPNRRIVSVPLARPVFAKARVEVPEEADATLVAMADAKDALYFVHNAGGHARLSRWPWTGKPATIALPGVGWVSNLTTDPLRDGVAFGFETWLAPRTIYRYDVATKQVVAAGFGTTITSDTSTLAVTEVEAPSADGTKVPLTILHAKNVALDGSHPAIVVGYGAYGFSKNPTLDVTNLAWIERGGVVAIAHVRGGGEKGRRWQDAGSREHKLNGIADLLACADYLVANRYTSRDKLAADGTSMGGILVGRAITEQPFAFAAAHLAVGVVNPLRLAVAPNGANQFTEVGDPRTEAGYKQILAMDPYHHVDDRTFPAVILTVGLQDRRVAPWMSAKLAARLLASKGRKQPVYLRLDADAGHGAGTTRDQDYLMLADVWSFFLHAFGDSSF